jgi:formylglycine-generating enzyme required for sulfatase activity
VAIPPPATVSFVYTKAVLDPSGHVTRSKGTAECFVPDIGGESDIQMVAIPAGKFLMGSPQTEAGRGNDEPLPHDEQVAEFYISRREVTQKEWRLVATTLPQVSIALPADPSTFKGDNQPVENISWPEAQEYAARISKRTGRNFTLPSRIQWEYACRAGTSSPFYFGETITPDVAAYNAEVGYGKAPAGGKPTEPTDVGKFESANQFGLDDMHGNVWEWCETEYVPHASQQSTTAGSPASGLARRVLRGGSFESLATDCRSASRYALQETARQRDVGFRLVMNPSTPK